MFDEDFEEHIMVRCGDDTEDPFFMKRRFFWCCTLLMCSFIYRAWFRWRTKHFKYVYFKLMKK